eukprot:7920006-Pyramimonas_sp.AAC.1
MFAHLRSLAGGFALGELRAQRRHRLLRAQHLRRPLLHLLRGEFTSQSGEFTSQCGKFTCGDFSPASAESAHQPVWRVHEPGTSAVSSHQPVQ